MKKTTAFLVLVFIVFSALPVQSQTTTNTESSTHFDMSGAPQWLRALRRGSIVAFGSFPFTYLATNVGYDTYRYSTHNWDIRYAPWPLAPADAEPQRRGEKAMVIGIAGAGAVLVALVDFSIVQIKRRRLERPDRDLAPGTPIIIRRPLHEEPFLGEEAETPAPPEEAP